MFRSDTWMSDSGGCTPSAFSPQGMGFHRSISTLQGHCFYGSKVLGNALGKGCSAFEFWSRVRHKNDSLGLWKGLLESSQNTISLSKYFGSSELITFPCLRLWGASL